MDANEQVQSDPWRITDDNRAAWAADKVLGARERLARVKASCQAMIDEAAREAQDAEAFFLPLLEEWARANPPRKGKTIRLPTGALAFRTVIGGPRLVDAKAALDWAREHTPSLIEITERVTITALKDYMEAVGEVPPGVEVVPDRESFDVKGARS